jgi:prepilin-type N-terminal cleavage/methylation domain-containing protein/prepilin-type processing-associated H-X9-DG protein
MDTHPRHRHAFSLIELLVSIAVIALLLGVMLPALSRAREAGRRSVCASNARQLVIASHAYADDHRDFMPAGAPEFLRNLTRWHGSRNHPSEAFHSRGGALSDYLGDAAAQGVITPVRSCPSFLTTMLQLQEAGAGFEVSCGGYGYNNTFVGVRRRRVGDVFQLVTDRTGSALSSFGRPAATICFGDAAFASDAGAWGVIEYSFVEPRFWPDRPGARADPSLHFRHGERGSVAWLDAHVSLEGMTFSWSSGLYGVNAQDVDIGFIGRADDNALYGEP